MKDGKPEPGDVVELKDKEAGFSDAETGFDISRDQQQKLGDKIGERTYRAIAAGGLLIVDPKAVKTKKGEK